MSDEIKMNSKLFNLDEDGIPIQNDDTAVVLRPNFNKDGTWDTTVHVNAVMMPNEKLDEDDADYLAEVTYALVACFHLMNTDSEFADKVANEMNSMNIEEHGEKNSNVIQLSTWTKTEGNA
tara:strand:- start:112 stop:474 length:363 start_codon:yes stop_codon:yes gene_type:complete